MVPHVKPRYYPPICAAPSQFGTTRNHWYHAARREGAHLLERGKGTYFDGGGRTGVARRRERTPGADGGRGAGKGRGKAGTFAYLVGMESSYMGAAAIRGTDINNQLPKPNPPSNSPFQTPTPIPHTQSCHLPNMVSISEEFRNLILAQKIQRLYVSNNAEAMVLLPLR
jgi:hypothetical protein